MGHENDTRGLNAWFYLGVFLVSICLLAFEIILTRILSTIFFYHFAFLIISVALFGLTTGALIVYCLPERFKGDRLWGSITKYSLLSSALLFLGLVVLFVLPLVFRLWQLPGVIMPALYVFLSLPFVSIGIVLTLCLTRFREDVSKVYGVNLFGSAIGCASVILLLNTFSAGTAVLYLASLTALSGAFFALGGKLRRTILVGCVAVAMVFAYMANSNERTPRIRPLVTKQTTALRPPAYDHWNFFSYLSVRTPSTKPFGWGYSSEVSRVEVQTNELMLQIDNDAGTVVTQFQDLRDLEYLRYDVSAVGYHVRQADKVLILGSGGGRDLLTAVLFGANDVTGVELNKDINRIVYEELKNFSGRILELPQIQFVVGEGRSYVSQSEEKFDFIQASLIDSWAAVASGAFALTENNLYTKEAWISFVEHLSDTGMIAFTRYYFEPPNEMYRMLSLAGESLRAVGIDNVRDHIAIVRNVPFDGSRRSGTILVSRSPFSRADLERLRQVCAAMKFELTLSPDISDDKKFDELLAAGSQAELLDLFEGDVRAPTDNRPFFFYFGRLGDLLDLDATDLGARALRQLFVAIFVFGSILVLIPALYRRRLPSARRGALSKPMMLYFTAIGLGFMLVEMAYIMRLGVYLGHPVYGLLVVLFGFLSAAGLGSYLTNFLGRKARLLVLAVLSVLLIAMIVVFPLLVTLTAAVSITSKVALTIVILAVSGLLMGMPFPIGMGLSGEDHSSRVVYWGLNGFCSVVGAALATVLLIHFGVQTALALGALCYVAAGLSARARMRAA